MPMGKGWITLYIHDHSAKVSVLSENIGKLGLSIVGADTTVRTDNYNEVITRINQALSKPYEDVSLMSTFQVRYNGTIINTSPM